jgi:O-succinylbenzoate synthase
MFTADVTSDPLVAVDGSIPVRPVTVDGDGWQAEARTARRWLARLDELPAELRRTGE